MPGNRQAVVLQARDRRLLDEMGALRLVDHEQARRIGGFGSYQRTHDRLMRLVRAGFLRRFFLPTEAGGRKSVYCLSRLGAELAGTEFRPLKRRSGGLALGELFAFHQLRVNAFLLELRYPAKAEPNLRLLSFRTFRQPLSPSVLLTPDGYCEVETELGVKAMFLEVDLGTETRKVWQRKIAHYLHLAASGEFGRLFNRPQFRVLVVTDSQRRRDNLRRLAAQATQKIFWFATFSSLKASGLSAPVWLRPSGDEPKPLV